MSVAYETVGTNAKNNDAIKEAAKKQHFSTAISIQLRAVKH